MRPRHTDPGRQGNALLAAVLVMGLAAVIIFSSTEDATSVQRTMSRSARESEVLAALDIVLARRQQYVSAISSLGKPEDFVAWDKGEYQGLPGSAGQSNYGVEFIGPVEVRWKVEPAWARGKVADGVTTDQFIENPTPGGDDPVDPASQPNKGSFYLYRISGEARYTSTERQNASSPHVRVTWDGGSATYTWDATAQSYVASAATGADMTEIRLTASPTDIDVRALGMRFVVTPNESSLNYLLYYAQRGPKADIELAHGPTVQLIGDIYSGGALYMGSATGCNDWAVLKPTDGDTIIGPPVAPSPWSAGTVYAVGDLVAHAGQIYQCLAAQTPSTADHEPGSGSAWKPNWFNVTAIRTRAIDGVYRLSKQMLISAINGYPIVGTAPAGYDPTTCYLLDAVPFVNERPNDPYPPPLYGAASLFEATRNGTVINPARARDVLATRSLTGPDEKRVFHVVGSGGIEKVYLRGVDDGTALANDSRDRAGTSEERTYLWRTDSLEAPPNGFNRQVRSSGNNAAADPLAKQFLNRPEEPQMLTYYELDGDPTTDEHEYALPVFLDTNGSHTTDFAQRRQVDRNGGGLPSNYADAVNQISNPDIDAIEVPGVYLAKALGQGNYMARRSDYRGWFITDANGSTTVPEPTAAGLVIRERPMPDVSYFQPNTYPGVNDPLFMPYAYGHVRPSLWPFIAADVTASSSATFAGTPRSNAFENIVPASQTFSYAQGGRITFTAANLPTLPVAAGNGPDPNTTTPLTNNLSWSDYSSGYSRFPAYFQDNWRFIALRRPIADTSVNGLQATYYNDRTTGASQWLGPFGGRPVFARTDANIDFLAWNSAAPTGATAIGADYFSVRWEGFIKPKDGHNELYTFRAVRGGRDGGVRVWVDDILVLDHWVHNGSDISASADKRVLMTSERADHYPIVVEYFEQTGSAGLQLQWMTDSLTLETVPTECLYPATNNAFDPATFQSVTARVDRVGSLATGKAGLMLRPSSGSPRLHDGRDPYLMLGYHPSRGVFVQGRGERSRSTQSTVVSHFVGSARLDRDGVGGFNDGGTHVPADAEAFQTTGELAIPPTQTYAPAAPPAPARTGVQRTARLVHVVDWQTGLTMTTSLDQNRIVTTYTPGKDGTTAGAPPDARSIHGGVADGAWPANSGKNPNLMLGMQILNTPFTGFSEGEADRIYFGQLNLRTQKWPQRRSTRTLTGRWAFRLDRMDLGINDLHQRFRWEPGLAWPADWPTPTTYTVDRNRAIYAYSDPTGSRTVTGGVLFTTNSSNANNSMSSVNPDAGQSLWTTGSGTTSDTGWLYWYDVPVPAAYYDTYDLMAPAGTPKTCWYLSSGGYDTRPKIYNGSTFVRYVTAAETLTKLNEQQAAFAPALGPWILETTVPTYPTPPNPPQRAQALATGTGTIPGLVPGWHRVTAVATTATPGQDLLTVTTDRPYSVDDYLDLYDAAGGYETVRVRATPPTVATNRLLVDRAQRGTARLAATNLQLCYYPVQATLLTADAGTGGTLSVVSTAGFVGNEILMIGSNAGTAELVRVTGIGAGTLTVDRGREGTTTVNHPAGRPVYTAARRAGRLQAAVTDLPTVHTTFSVTDLRAAVGDVLQLGGELVLVTDVPSTTSIVVERGYALTTRTTHPLNELLIHAVPKTFSASRGRYVTHDIHSWISAGGMAPTDDENHDGVPDSGAVDAPLGGWWYTNLNADRPFSPLWNGMVPKRATGGWQARVSPLTALPPPTTDYPPAPNFNALTPPNMLVDDNDTDLRAQDDQPALWQSGRVYAVGDLCWYAPPTGTAGIFRCGIAHTATIASTPGSTGGATYWIADQGQVWLRVERIPNTTRVRLLYAIGSSTEPPATAWRAVLRETDTRILGSKSGTSGTNFVDYEEVEFDIGPWFAGAMGTLNNNVVGSTINSIETWNVANAAAFRKGDVLAIDDEQVLVEEDGSGTTLKVRRAFNGTANLTTSTPAQDYVPSHIAGAILVPARLRGSRLAIGLCSQSGTRESSGAITPYEASFSMCAIRTSEAAPNDVIDANDWDLSLGADVAARYVASQYQVFFGPYDITEDFVTWNGSSNLSEDWMYNLREFWSQSRWWYDHPTLTSGSAATNAKDPTAWPDSLAYPSNRELLAKTTLLHINLDSVQQYLRSRTLADATDTTRLAGGTGLLASSTSSDLLMSRVATTGLVFHVSRYNRFPWNPNFSGKNPWNPYLAAGLNTSGMTNADREANPNPVDSQNARDQHLVKHLDTANDLKANTLKDLFPYVAGSATPPSRAPAFMPQDFHHGVLLSNGSDLGWALTGGGDAYGSSKFLFVTPNALYIQGDFNTQTHVVTHSGVTVSKTIPAAVFCDNATFLSNAFNIADYQKPGFALQAPTYTSVLPGSTGTLTYNQPNGPPLPSVNPGPPGSPATTTTYQMALLTHNQPTTKHTVEQGESSSFINTMMFVEDWANNNFTFIGSLVVMDSRRYTQAHLLDTTKRYGRSPFGFMGSDSWMGVYGAPTSPASPAANGHRWAGEIRAIYGAPDRRLIYNPDFKTKEGTPPEMPFGIKTIGLGGWVRIVR